jgi:hypothetical protein
MSSLSLIITATGTINISYSEPNVYYNINGIGEIMIEDEEWPVIIDNSDTSTTLKVLFTTDIILTSSNPIVADKLYFICGNNNIQFGDSALKPDGTRPIITIKDIPNYPGLLLNYNSLFLESFNIYVYNLFVKSVGSSLAIGGGWIGQKQFSINTNGYFINCSSDGEIPTNCGGIVGESSGGTGGILYTSGCSSFGNIQSGGGGIIGAGSLNVRCLSCFSTGNIYNNAGGIVGQYASSNTIENCYSTGNIISGAGIVAADSDNSTVFNCYNTGTVSVGGGGIFGNVITDTSIATNCYTINGNIFAGTLFTPPINCYAAGGTWSDSVARVALTGTPSGSSVGTTWISLVPNTPYVLKSFGGSPYTLANIVANDIVQIYSASINPGESTIPAPVAGYKTFQIMDNPEPTITIDNTGVITTTTTTPPESYPLIIYAVDDYTTTEFTLEVLAQIPILNILAQTIPPCCEPNVPQSNPQASNYNSDIITNKKGGKTLDKNVEDFYVGVATGQRTAYSQPIFKSYYDYMNYLQGKYK